MNNITTNILFIAVLLGIAALGAILGFGRSLKLTTRGVFGIVLSVVFCVLFGGALLAIPAIGGLVDRGNDHFRGVWNFFGVIRLAIIIYFVVLFFVFQILRIIITSIIKKISETDKKAVKIFNKIGGALFLVTFAFTLCLCVLAGMRLFEQTDAIANAVYNMQYTFLYTLYRYNPITLGS